MCGIAGVVRRDGAIDPDPSPLLGGALAHRGPDGRGVWRSPARDAVLVHTRLAIIDPGPSGAQPMATPDGRHRIVFNGEVYNYRELRRSLEARGERFTTGSDTEVLLRLLACDGPGALAQVRGMFALAWWDAEARALVLARDRFGIKPLYVAATGSLDRVRVGDSRAVRRGSRRPHHRSGRRAGLPRVGNGAAVADLCRRRREPGSRIVAAVVAGRRLRPADVRRRRRRLRPRGLRLQRSRVARAGGRRGAAERGGASGRRRAGRCVSVRRHRLVGDPLGRVRRRRRRPQHLHRPVRRSLVRARVREARRVHVRRDASRAAPRFVAYRQRSAAHPRAPRSADARRGELVLRVGGGGGDRDQGGALRLGRRRDVRRLSVVPPSPGGDALEAAAAAARAGDDADRLVAAAGAFDGAVAPFHVGQRPDGRRLPDAARPVHAGRSRADRRTGAARSLGGGEHARGAPRNRRCFDGGASLARGRRRAAGDARAISARSCCGIST